MQNLKRVLSLVLVIAMVCSFMLSASAATGEQLTDLADSKFQPEVRVLNALGIVEGYEDGTYKPAQDVTRAELALILARVRVGGDKDMIATYNYGHMTYTDVLANGYVWAASGIQYCTDNGMVVGDGNGKYRPGDTVTVVEGLKMLLTALGYSAEIEGLQNVGAAWKANTLSLAREVGLMDRFYGDTNKNMTRDDLALLVYNFLMSDVVKGYYQNDVANVDTIMYVGGTALEVYFGKQVIYGVVVANEAANLDVFEYAKDQFVADDDAVLTKGYTRLYLYEDDENGYTLADYVTHANYDKVTKGSRNKAAAWEDALENVFVDVKLTTGLSELGESVFVITDLEPVKGSFVAVGDLCFDTGLNTIGVEQWTAPNLIGLTNNDTLYVNDYDVVDAQGELLDNAAGRGNGDFYKTVDFDGDGKLDLVMVENWGMVNLFGTDKKGNVRGSAAVVHGDHEWTHNGWNTGVNMAADPVTFGMVNFHYADGLYYTVAAESLAGLKLAAGNDAVNFKNGYITLSDDNKYYQSYIWNFSGLTYEDIMDCAQLDNAPSAMKNYTWYLDCGGYIRAYGLDATVYDGLYLLTDATSEKTGRNAYAKTVDTYKESSEKVNYSTNDMFNAFIADDDKPYGNALTNRAVDGIAVTNLAAGIAADTSIALADATVLNNVDNVVELRDWNGNNTFYTNDGYAKYGDYNINNGGDYADIVYTTTETDYYYVVLAEDRDGVYVKSVEYFDGYLNVKGFDFDAREVAYAAVSKGTSASGDPYFYAEAVVVETFESTTNVVYPYFAYEHVSAGTDNTTGTYAAIAPNGEDGTYIVAGVDAAYIDAPHGAVGFYSFNGNNNVASMIVDNWADYGISAHTVEVAKTGTVDYYVLDNVGGKQIKVTEDTPVYLVKAARANGHTGREVVAIEKYAASMNNSDKIILVTKGPAIQYILLVDSVRYDWGWDSAAQVAIDLWTVINENGHLYDDAVVAAEFEAAVKAYAASVVAGTPDETLYDAMLTAWAAYYETDDTATSNAYVADLVAYFADETITDYNAFKALVNAAVVGGKIVIDDYMDGVIAAAFAELSAVELEYVTTYGCGADDAAACLALIRDYREVANVKVGLAEDLVAAYEAYAAYTGSVAAELEVLENDLIAAYEAFIADTTLTYKATGDVADAVAAAEAL